MKDNINKPHRRLKGGTATKRILLTLLLTIALTNVFMDLSDKALTHLGNIGSTAIYTQNYSLGVLNYVFIIPAALISFFAIKIVYYIAQKTALSAERKSDFKLDRQNVRRILWDTIFPITAFLLGLLSINSLLGITQTITALFRHPSTFDSLEQLMSYVVGADSGLAMISIFIPFDVTILFYVLISFGLVKMCAVNCSKRESLAKKGMRTAVICLIISVPLGVMGIVIPGTVYSAVYAGAIGEMKAHADGYYLAKEDDYILSDAEVILDEFLGGYFVATGTITNTTEYDWEYVTFEVWFTNVNDANGNFVKDSDKIPKTITPGQRIICKIENLPAGGSADFTSDGLARIYTSDTDYDAKYKIFDMEYKIVLEEGADTTW